MRLTINYDYDKNRELVTAKYRGEYEYLAREAVWND